MEVKICTGKACSGKFSKYILTRIQNDISFYNWKKIILEETPCMGACKKGPNIKIDNDTHNYVVPSKASELIYNKFNPKPKPKPKPKSKKKK